jgi:trehalose/maltose hydrolase-like predicted phosphorylase
MLLALLPDWFSRRSVEANYRYYERRTGHGSSLSPAIHALVAARIGELAAAERYFHQAAEIDLNEDAGAAAQGVHMAALGGLWSAVALGFAGILPRRGALHLQPNVPAGWRSLALTFRWRGRRLRYRIQQAPLRVTLQHTAGAAPIPIVVGNLRHRLSVSAAWTCWWDDATSSWKEGAP